MEEFEDIIDAHDTVMFVPQRDATAQLGIDILTFIGLPPHVIDVSDQPVLEQAVRANIADLDLPAIFMNGQYFSDPFVLADAARTGALARFLDAVGADYDAQAVADIFAANQG